MPSFSRRNLLKLLSAAPGAAWLALRPPVDAATRPSTGTLNLGLFFDEADVPRLREHYASSTRFASLRDRLADVDAESEYAFIANELRYNDQLFHLKRLADTALRQSFRALMTEREDARELAVACVRELVKFDRWDLFLDGDKPLATTRAPLASMAVVSATDWLGDAISDTERRDWLVALGQRGCEACYNALYAIRNPTEVTEWRFDTESTFFEHRPGNRTDLNRRAEITQNTNLRAVPASALVIAATAHQLEFGTSVDANRWLEMGTHSIRAFKDLFAPDGSYDEETGYANYTAEHIAQAAVVAARHGGEDLFDAVPWDAYIDFQLNMTMPTDRDPYGVVNFGDSGNRSSDAVTRAALPTWIAAHTGNPLAQWYATHRAGNDSLWSVLWHDPSIEAQPPPEGSRLWASDMDRVVARTGWAEDDLVVAMRSGAPANHEHADRNSLIVKAHGQILVADPLRPPYSYAAPAWTMRLTRGHSAILVDGRGHEHHNGVEGTNASNSYARITRNESTDTYALWTSIATQPYRLVDLQIKDVIRSVVVLYKEGVVVVVDQVAKYDEASTVTARFFGDNTDESCQMRPESDGFVIYRPGAVLKAQVVSDAEFMVLTGEPFVPAATADKHPFIDVVTEPTSELVMVTAMAVSDRESSLTPVEVGRVGNGFLVSAGERSIRVAADDINVT